MIILTLGIQTLKHDDLRSVNLTNGKDTIRIGVFDTPKEADDFVNKIAQLVQKQPKLFLFHFHDNIRIVSATDGEKALDSIQERYPFDRTMLRNAMIELDPGPQKLLNGGYRPTFFGILYDQKELE